MGKGVSFLKANEKYEGELYLAEMFNNVKKEKVYTLFLKLKEFFHSFQ